MYVFQGEKGYTADDQYDAKTFESAPMDVPPPMPKPKIKKEKSDKIKTSAEKPSIPPVKTTPAQPASMMPPTNGNTAKPIPSGLGSSTARQPPLPNKQKDLALTPKVVPSKRPSDVSSSAPVPEKKPHLSGNTPKVSTTSAPTRPVTNGNGTTPPKGLPRPAPPPGRPPPPPPPTRAAEDVLFIKKKKVSHLLSAESKCALIEQKKPNNGPPPPAGGPSVRDRYK